MRLPDVGPGGGKRFFSHDWKLFPTTGMADYAVWNLVPGIPGKIPNEVDPGGWNELCYKKS
jgi:hypothetical protein